MWNGSLSVAAPLLPVAPTAWRVCRGSREELGDLRRVLFGGRVIYCELGLNRERCPSALLSIVGHHQGDRSAPKSAPFSHS